MGRAVRHCPRSAPRLKQRARAKRLRAQSKEPSGKSTASDEEDLLGPDLPELTAMREAQVERLLAEAMTSVEAR